jgi:hypothetical protein
VAMNIALGRVDGVTAKRIRNMTYSVRECPTCHLHNSRAIYTCGACGRSLVDANEFDTETPRWAKPGAHNGSEMSPASGAAANDSRLSVVAPQVAVTQATYRGNVGLCIGLGIVFLIIGGLLLVFPSSGDSGFLGRPVVNLQRLYIGQTTAIIGAIFLAVGIRPR